MKIQSLSVVVPTKKCINNCKFCVACMLPEEYKNQMDDNLPFYDLYLEDYMKRLDFARDNGVNTLMLTGNGEPQQNRQFLTYFGIFMRLMKKPFRNIEMQTSGVLLDDPYLRFLRNHVGVNTISLSLSSLNNEINKEYNGIRDNLAIDIKWLCGEIKKYDFNLRLSLNMTDFYNSWEVKNIFKYCREELHADQITFRILYESGLGTLQDQWIKEHQCNYQKLQEIVSYVEITGTPLQKLEYGRTKYSVHEMSTIVDNDCMSKEVKEELKYLILRPDCKLYSRWDDPSSLIF